MPRHDGNGRFTRIKVDAERDAQVVELYSIDRLSFQQIADRLGFRSKSTAHDAFRRGMAAIPAEKAEEAKRICLEQLDFVFRETLAVMRRPHYVPITSGPNAGELVRHPETGELLIDDAPVLTALTGLVRVNESTRKLIGLDAPRKAQVSVITTDALSAWIAEGEQELAALDAPVSNGDRSST